MLLLLTACAAPVPVPVLISDMRGDAVSLGDAQAGTRETSWHPSDLEPDVCNTENSGRYCLIYQSRYRQTLAGAGEVLFTYSALDQTDGSDEDPDDLRARYVGLDVASGAMNWSISALDFADVTNGACSADPCLAPGVASQGVEKGCFLSHSHDMELASEDGDALELWLADTGNARLLRVRVPPDDPCATVLEILDRTEPDWDIYASPNSLVRWQDGGGEHLLFTTKGTSAGADGGAEQRADVGRGKIVSWLRPPGNDWAQAWEFPPRSTDEPSFVNTPHGVTRIERDDGSVWVVFAHSLSRSARWNEGSGGSFGFLELVDGAPEYRGDGTISGDLPLQWPRDVQDVGDGRLLLTDSGCLGPDCERASGSWLVAWPEDLDPGAADGVWTQDHARLSFFEFEVLSGPAWDDAELLYSAQPLP